ncbi:alpha/beta fold hydrolase [Streptomyces phytohabitans]|uniref:alpha/beta fold hydrolase n=1 Tax=Streptomyces phytohabitans TaxID=1150371 RepID=UPI00345C3217
MTDQLTAGTARPRPRVLPDYPFRSRWFDSSAGRQHYVDEGPSGAPPVLMLHGNPTWSYYWRHLVGGLRADHRCVAPDLGGMGLSSRPAEPFTPEGFEARAERVEGLVRHLVREEGAPENGWTLVVHDWGGPLGLRWACARPERVARLVVLNSMAFPWPEGHRLHWGLRAVRGSAALARLSHRGNLFARGVTYLGLRTRMPRAVRSAYLAPYARVEERRAVEEFVRAIPLRPADPGWDLAHRLGEGLEVLRDVPTLLCWGMRDPVFDDRVLAEWLRRMPHARPRLYPEAGHLLLEDAPSGVTRDVRAFLAETAGVAGTTDAANTPGGTRA